MKFGLVSQGLALSGLALMVCVSQAQQAPAAGGVPFVGVTPIVAQPGQYEINSRDVSKAMSEVIERVGKVQDSDLRYLDSVVSELTKSANAYNKLLAVDDFKKLSDKAYSKVTSGNAGVSVEEFLEVLNRVREARLTIETNLQLLTSVSGALPSDAVINDGKVSNKLPSPRNIDFSKVTEAVMGRVSAVEKIASNYPFVIVHSEGLQVIEANSGTALNPVLNFPLMTGERVRQLQAQVRVLTTPSEEFELAAESHGNLTKGLIAKFIKNYGQSEKYRPRDERDEEARKEAFTNVVNAFWMRSYLRKVYGIRLGALIPANYKKRYLNIDKYLVLSDQLTQFKEEVGPSQVDDGTLADAAENIRQVMETVDERAAKIMTGDASFLAKVNSFVTFLKGERPTAECLVLVMALVAADIKEELDLSLGGGLEALVAGYHQRWAATEMDQAATDKRVCAFDHLANLENGGGSSNCYQGNPESGIKGIFVTLNDEANAQSTKIENAFKIRDQIRLAQLANSLANSNGEKSTGPGRRRGR